MKKSIFLILSVFALLFLVNCSSSPKFLNVSTPGFPGSTVFVDDINVGYSPVCLYFDQQTMDEMGDEDGRAKCLNNPYFMKGTHCVAAQAQGCRPNSVTLTPAWWESKKNRTYNARGKSGANLTINLIEKR